MKTMSDPPISTDEVAELLQRAARSTTPDLPDPHLVWWRAEIVRRLVEDDPRAERVQRSLRRGHVLIAAAGLLAVFVWLVHLAWNPPSFAEPSLGLAMVFFAGLFIVPFAALGAGILLHRDG